MTKQADRLWSDLVRERDGWACQYPTCGIIFPPSQRGGLQAHHIFGRGRAPAPRMKYMLENGVALCVQHHLLAHAHPLGFAEMMRTRLGAEAYEELGRLSRMTKASI